MSDIKWIKLATNMHDDEKIKLIDAMPERDTIHYLWIRLLIQAGKTNANGFIYLNENIPYTDEMLSTLFSRPLASVRLALKVLSDFQMIEIEHNNVIKIVNWERHQNVEGMDRVREQNRKRVEKHRQKKRQLKAVVEEDGENSSQIQSDEQIGNDQITSDSSVKSSNVFRNDHNNLSEKLEENNCNAAQNSCNVTQSLCNVKQDLCNVTVTEQNKKEIKKKNKNKKREIENIESEVDNNLIYLKGTSEVNKFTHVKDVIHSEYSSNQNLKFDEIKAQNDVVGKYEIQSVDPNLSYRCARLSKYHESITGRPGGLENGKLRGAIAIHGEASVKMAIDEAIKVGKDDINYINGILSNWRREGYPDDKEVKKNVTRSYGKNSNPDKNEFKGFKPKKPRKLTDEERRKAEENLI